MTATALGAALAIVLGLADSAAADQAPLHDPGWRRVVVPSAACTTAGGVRRWSGESSVFFLRKKRRITRGGDA